MHGMSSAVEYVVSAPIERKLLREFLLGARNFLFETHADDNEEYVKEFCSAMAAETKEFVIVVNQSKSKGLPLGMALVSSSDTSMVVMYLRDGLNSAYLTAMRGGDIVSLQKYQVMTRCLETFENYCKNSF